MKKNVIRSIIFAMIIILVIEIPCLKYAEEVNIPSIMDEDVTDGVNPEKTTSDGIAEKLSTPFSDLILEVVQNVLGAIQIIGGLLTIISVAVYGLMMLLGTQPGLTKTLGIDNDVFGGYNPNTRKKLMEYIRLLIIGAALLFSSSSIVVFVMGILLN